MHRIDPRIVIIQIVLSGICAFWIFKPLAMLCEVLFLMSFLLYAATYFYREKPRHRHKQPISKAQKC